MSGQSGEQQPAGEQHAGPLVTQPSQEPANATYANQLFSMFLCILYICCSATLIIFNKFLMNTDRFPYAWVLGTWHVFCTSLFCLILYLIAPSLFPSAERAYDNVKMVCKFFPMISILFIVGVVCSNQAYMYCSVAFLQFMKEWNVAMVFSFSCIVGLQTCDRVKVAILVWIVCATCVTVQGELSFSHMGFLIQCFSQLGETTKTVFQEFVLGGGGLKLDPLTYQICMGPFAFIPLAIGSAVTWNPEVLVRASIWWPYLVVNGMCAVLLNISIAMLIKKVGAVGFMLSGIVKDVVIVVTATWVSGHQLSVQQITGFVTALGGIACWSTLKMDPNHWTLRWLKGILGATGEDETDVEAVAEKTKLLQGSSRRPTGNGIRRATGNGSQSARAAV